MKLGVVGGVAPGGDWRQMVQTARLADELGYDSLWLGETWAYELFASLSQIAQATERVKLGAGIANVFSRSATVIAMGAATIDAQSDGRLILGLGSSGPIVVEKLHGVPFDRPLRRLREYTDVINTLIAGERLDYHGELLQLDQGFRLRMNPIRSHIPIYIASLTPKSLEQSGEIADGVLPIYWPGAKFGEMRSTLDEASESEGRPPGSTRIAPYIPPCSSRLRTNARRCAAGHVAQSPSTSAAWVISTPKCWSGTATSRKLPPSARAGKMATTPQPPA